MVGNRNHEDWFSEGWKFINEWLEYPHLLPRHIYMLAVPINANGYKSIPSIPTMDTDKHPENILESRKSPDQIDPTPFPTHIRNIQQPASNQLSASKSFFSPSLLAGLLCICISGKLYPG